MLRKVINKIEEFAPLSLASSWDNTGWQVNLGRDFVSKIMLCLTVTSDVLEQAKKNNCDLIISHHPLLFDKYNKINTEIDSIAIAIEAIRNNIQIYSAHTNLDCCSGGVSDTLAKVIGLTSIYAPEENSFIRIGEYKGSCFFKDVYENLNLDAIRYSNWKRYPKKVAVVAGSGSSLFSQLKGVDTVVTGDVSFHRALDAEAMDIQVIDIGHFESERVILPVLKDLLRKLDVEVIIADEESPWRYYYE